MRKVLWQILFWAIFGFIWQRLVYFYVTNPTNRWLFTAFDTSLIVLTFYILYKWITPTFFHRKNKSWFAGGFVLSVGGCGLLMVAVMQFFLHRQVVPIRFQILWTYDQMVRNRYFVALLGACAGLTVWLATRWLRADKDRIASELQYLKAQVNPHFLFNAINTIYIQMDLSGEEARETLSVFSDMLRYQLYECNGDSIPLVREMEYLQHYIHLQRLRKEATDEVDFRFSGDANGAMIAPFLLIPLIENMFKHGGEHIRGEFCIAPDRLIFTGLNTKGPLVDGGGIGLTNLRRRLDLVYPRRHSLVIRDQPTTFEVCLEVQLR